MNYIGFLRVKGSRPCESRVLNERRIVIKEKKKKNYVAQQRV